MGQTLHITKVLAIAGTLSIKINFYHDLKELPQQQNVQYYLLTDLQLQFLKIHEDNETHKNRKKCS